MNNMSCRIPVGDRVLIRKVLRPLIKCVRSYAEYNRIKYYCCRGTLRVAAIRKALAPLGYYPEFVVVERYGRIETMSVFVRPV